MSDLSFSLFDIVLIIGIIQGVLASILLFTARNNKASNRLLGASILLLAVIIFKMFQHNLGLWNIPWYRFAPLAFDLSAMPVFYLFMLKYTGKPLGKWWLHLIPSAIFMIHALIVYFDTLPTGDLAIKDQISESWSYNSIKNIEDFLTIPVNIIYGVACILLLRKFKQEYELFPKMKQSIRWLSRGIFLIIGLVLIGAVMIFIEQLNPFGQHFAWHRYIFYGFATFSIYYWGWTGYRQTQLPEIKTPVRKVSNEKISKYYPKILAALKEEKLYLDPSLKLSTLAKKLGINSAELSQVVKLKEGKSIRDFINQFRVEAVKQKLKDPDLSHLSVLGVALECGFNSEASFYRIFKNMTGQSPTDFRKNHS